MTENKLVAIQPSLTSVLHVRESQEKGHANLKHYLVAKGLPALPMKLVKKTWNQQYQHMEEFLPTTWSPYLAKLEGSKTNLQDSLVVVLNQFQVIKDQQGLHWCNQEIITK